MTSSVNAHSADNHIDFRTEIDDFPTRIENPWNNFVEKVIPRKLYFLFVTSFCHFILTFHQDSLSPMKRLLEPPVHATPQVYPCFQTLTSMNHRLTSCVHSSESFLKRLGVCNVIFRSIQCTNSSTRSCLAKGRGHRCYPLGRYP